MRHFHPLHHLGRLFLILATLGFLLLKHAFSAFNCHLCGGIDSADEILIAASPCERRENRNFQCPAMSITFTYCYACGGHEPHLFLKFCEEHASTTPINYAYKCLCIEPKTEDLAYRIPCIQSRLRPGDPTPEEQPCWFDAVRRECKYCYGYTELILESTQCSLSRIWPLHPPLPPPEPVLPLEHCLPPALIDLIDESPQLQQ